MLRKCDIIAKRRNKKGESDWPEEHGGIWFACGLLRRYLDHEVGRQSAAMAYYLLFAIFPVLIFVSALLGVLDLDLEGIIADLSRILPRAVVDLCEMYLTHVSDSSNAALLGFSLVFSIWFPARATNGLMDCVRRAYGLRKPVHPIRYRLKMLLLTGFLFLAMLVALLLVTLGQRVLSFLAGSLALPPELLSLWNGLRFVILAALLLAAMGLLYAVSQDSRQPARYVLPGAVSAAAAWVLLSIAFSFYVENFANYSVVYGTLGAVVVLLVWLFLSAVALILGAELNGMIQIQDLKKAKNREENENENYHYR